MTVEAALAAFEDHLALVESALDAGELVELPQHDTTPLTGPVTLADRERLEHALVRLAGCQRRIQAQQAAIADELGVLGARRDAAEAYTSND